MREGWTYKKLGEVCTSITDGSHNPPKGIEHSEYRMISSQNVFDDDLRIDDETVRFLTEEDHYKEDKRTKLSKDVVLLTIVGTIGRACVLKGTEGFITLQRSVSALHPSSEIHPRFLMHSLIGNRERLNQEAHGIAQRGIYLRQLSELEIPIPLLSEQQSIVAELDKINELISLKKAQLSDLDNLAQSIFCDMFGDPIENEKGWEVKKLGEACSLKAGKSIKASDLVEKKDNIFPCYGGNGIRGYIDRFSHEMDLPIIGRQGALCGNVNFAKGPFYATEHAVVVTPVVNLDVVWLYYILKGLRLENYAHGVAQPGISVGDLNPIPLPIPPLPLQQEFAKRIELIEQQKAQINSTIKDLETLLASRMQHWFD